MQKRVVSLIAFVFVVGASFYLGTFVNVPSVVVEDPNEVLQEVLDAIIDNHYKQPSSEELMDGAIEGIIASLDDPYTTYFDLDEYESYQSGFNESYVGVGVTVSVQEDLIIVEAVKDGGPADQAGILPNDILVEVDGIDIRGMDFYEAVEYVTGEEGTEVTLGVLRQGIEDVISLTMTRAIIESSTVSYTTYTEGEETVGYIKVTTFGDETADLFDAAIVDLESQGITGLVIDLRNNGGGHLFTVVNMLQQFLVKDGREMFSIEYYQDGNFMRNEYEGMLTEKKAYDIVTLVNEHSASASEVFASAMKEHGDYPVVGTTTFGKGTMQVDKELATTEGDSLHISIGKWITADGNWVHYDGGTDGVTPTIEVYPSEEESAYKLFLFDGETLHFDMVDYRVENLQYMLNAMGYNVRTDGYFDADTRNAISVIQTEQGFTISGIVDTEVLEFINASLDDYQNNPENDSQLQEALDYFYEQD